MKKFTKLMAVMLACAMLFAIAIPVASVAAADVVPITIETVEANPGDTEVEVQVIIPADPIWGAIQFTVKFDPSALTFSEFETNEAVQKQQTGGKPVIFALNDDKAAEGEVLVSFASSVTDGGYEGYYPVDKKGKTYDYFGTFYFDVASDAAGFQKISILSVEQIQGIRDGAQTNLEYSATDGGIQLPGGEEPPVHEHVFGEWTVTKEATCTEAGERERVCECGEKETEAIPALGHDYKETDRVAATCEEAGKIVYTCANCGDVKEEAIDPLGHDWGEWEVTKEATVD